jgi:branched-chain amino acid transport system permease protein
VRDAVGVLFGIPSLRIKGLYLAVATLAAQFFWDWAFLRVKLVHQLLGLGLGVGVQRSTCSAGSSTPPERYLLLPRLPDRVRAAGQEPGAQPHRPRVDGDPRHGRRRGRHRHPPVYAKLTAFAVSSFIVGVAGALWGFVHLGAWEPAAFSIDRSFQLLFMVIIGGLGSIMGSFFGAAFIVVLPIFLNQALPALGGLIGVTISTAAVAHTEFMIFGALIVFFLIVEPHGLARLWSIGKEKLRLWPFPH